MPARTATAVDLDLAALADRARVSTSGDAYSPYLPAHRRAMRRALIAVALAVVDGAAAAEHRERTDAALDDLTLTQRPSGLFAGGDNGESPPDSSFTANDLCRAIRLIDRSGVAGLDAQRARLVEIGSRLAPALLVGGVHTPNHRWEIASALAALGEVLGHPSLSEGAIAWLAEGVDIDADGMYSERSANYAVHVSGPCLIELARLLGRDDLAAAVERNLRATLPLIDDRGRVETVHSRRQDQSGDFDAEPYLPLLLWAARRTQDARFTAAADDIVRRGLTDPASRLVEILDAHDDAPLPPGAPRSDHETAVLPSSGLVRWRDDALTTTVFAGSDFATTGRIASGLSNSSTLVRARRGDLELRALRIAPEFFGIGALRPRLVFADEHTAVLQESRSAAFYGPLPITRLRAGGDYPLTPDGRFFAAMDFGARPKHPHTLRSDVTISRAASGFTLDAAWQGMDVPVAVELVFPAGHSVLGADFDAAVDALVPTGASFVVRSPSGAELAVSWTGGEPAVTGFDEGESFTAVGGRDRVDGVRVLVPTRTTRDFVLTVSL
ncbi:hypothetical protein JOD63_000009 [Microbacterium terrae]|uniref:Heparinase II/III-like protein n=1 Tax=Microbacterium terrae TaxID=69369 RepID=A0A0M2H2W4_9MICO|nr:hypothetical protein [Microbacterium terrae]KJL38623.1 hypothetical protein RS81_02418 [Microbacterium terrae]MBP1076041.1 hypothetical protein [Microbacterium terrae]GLJ96861.1 hypothetical protein GCM10017594_00580 [Microbacterium terrae]